MHSPLQSPSNARFACHRYHREQHNLKDAIRGKEEEVITCNKLADELRRQEAQVKQTAGSAHPFSWLCKHPCQSTAGLLEMTCLL